MKTILLVASVILLLSSCNKCVECSHKLLNPVKMCEKDAPSNDEYNKTVTALTNAGYTCNEK